MSETGLRGIQPAELDQFWPVAAPLLERGLKHGAGYRWIPGLLGGLLGGLFHI